MPGDNIEVITFHGWGFSPEIWSKAENNLNELENLVIRHADRGYFGNEYIPDFKDSDSKKILMVHSYGLHWCPDEWIDMADQIIIISGFLTFHPEDSDRSGHSRHTLRQMKSRFVTKPDEVLSRFYKNVFDPVVTDYQIHDVMNHDLLLEDLEQLGSSVISPDILHRTEKIILLHGENDRIVSNRKSHVMFSMLSRNAQYFEIKYAGHGILYTHAEECTRFIKPNFNLDL
jgi:pimeloyl-[acyl-carrier protein] methyl ester esterase